MLTSILPTIENQLNFYGYTISMIMGNIGNIFIIIIFTRQRQNTCSIFLITSAIVNTLFVKHDLKGVLKCIGVKVRTPPRPPPPTYRDGHFSNPSLTVTDTAGTHYLP